MLLLVCSENRATGHPSDRERIDKLYKQLWKELDAKTINPKLRKALAEDLNRVANSYNEYIDPKINAEENNHARAFVYFVGRFIHGFFKQHGLLDKKPPKPNKAIIQLHAIQTWMQSIDIKKMLGFKNEDEKELLSSLDGTLENEIAAEAVETESFLNDEIIYESFFSDAEYERLNASVTTESYFGKKPIVENSIQHVKDIRSLLPKKNGYIPQDAKQKILDILTLWGKELSTEFNVEETCFGLENIYNAAAIPLFCGNSIQFKAANEVKIIESSQGYRFEKKDNLFFIMILGIRFLTDTKLTDETIVAILFHEIGHGFQQYKNETLKKQKTDTIVFNTVGLIKSFLYSVATFQIMDAISTAFSLITASFTKFGIGKDRNNYMSEITSDTSTTLTDTEFKDGKAVKEDTSKMINPLTAIILGVQSVLGFIVSIIPIPGIASFLRVIVYDPLFLLDLAVRGAYFSRQKRNEYFADAFATAYGLGGDLSNLSASLYEMANNDICDIPVVNVIVQFNILGSVSMLMALDDHPTHQQRIRATYDYLEKELNTNKTLTPVMRKKVLEDLNHVKKLYNDMISPYQNIKNGRIGQGILWFCLGVFVKLKSTAKDAADIMAPIIANKITVVKTGLAVFAEKKKIQQEFGVDMAAVKVIADKIIES
jgi:hypothetical protein